MILVGVCGTHTHTIHTAHIGDLPVVVQDRRGANSTAIHAAGVGAPTQQGTVSVSTSPTPGRDLY